MLGENEESVELGRYIEHEAGILCEICNFAFIAGIKKDGTVVCVKCVIY